MPEDDDNVNLGHYLGIGLQVMVGALLGFAVGHWLDKKFQWAPWGTVVGSLLGIASGMYLLLKDALKANRD